MLTKRNRRLKRLNNFLDPSNVPKFLANVVILLNGGVPRSVSMVCATFAPFVLVLSG